MPARDFQPPDDFPDLTLPERTEKTPEPFRPAARSSRTSWREGDRVLAPWEPDFLYVGRIAQIKDSQALIEFENGDAGWVQVEQVRAVAVKRGQQVLSRRSTGPHFYPGEILEVRGDEVCVGFADGQGEEWTRLAALRIPCQQTGPGATPTRTASHLAFYDTLQPGTRVWAPWNSATLFAGTVDVIQGDEVHIHFDDGDRGWVLIQQLVPLEIPVGLRVMGRWKMGSHFYPGTVTEVQGERVHIQYDDGDREWTRAAALALPCEPFGPDARPTRTVSAWNGVLGWLVPVFVGLVFVFLRSGCR
jgi:hypothetical protein